jgi:hypothetical protein
MEVNSKISILTSTKFRLAWSPYVSSAPRTYTTEFCERYSNLQYMITEMWFVERIRHSATVQCPEHPQNKYTTSTKTYNIWIDTKACDSEQSKNVVIIYTHKNAQVVAMLMKTGLNNVLLPTLFTLVNNIEQYCYTRFRLNDIVQYCWQVWTTWAAKHWSILLSNGLGVFCRVCMAGVAPIREKVWVNKILGE